MQQPIRPILPPPPTNTNLYFNQKLLPALKRRCHAAICDEDLVLPLQLTYRDVGIDNILDRDVFSRSKAFVVYSEDAAEPLVSKFDGGGLLRGGAVRQGSYGVQITVYSKDVGVCYELGDHIMDMFDLFAKRRNDFRYFRLMDRKSLPSEEIDGWVGIYKIKVQLQVD